MRARKRTRRARATRSGTQGRRPLDTGRVRRAGSTVSSSEVIAVGVVTVVKDALVSALAGAQNVGTEVGHAAMTVIRGTIKAAAEIGGDLGTVTKEAVKGTITAAAEIGGELTGVARSAARSAVKTTADLGGDAGIAARKAVEGSTAAAREIGGDVGALAKSAATGASEAAERSGASAARAVRATLGEGTSAIAPLTGGGKRRRARDVRNSGGRSRVTRGEPGVARRAPSKADR